MKTMTKMFNQEYDTIALYGSLVIALTCVTWFLFSVSWDSPISNPFLFVFSLIPMLIPVGIIFILTYAISFYVLEHISWWSFGPPWRCVKIEVARGDIRLYTMQNREGDLKYFEACSDDGPPPKSGRIPASIWYEVDREINGYPMSRLVEFLKEKGRLWFLITFGSEVLKEIRREYYKFGGLKYIEKFMCRSKQCLENRLKEGIV